MSSVNFEGNYANIKIKTTGLLKEFCFQLFQIKYFHSQPIDLQSMKLPKIGLILVKIIYYIYVSLIIK